MSSKYSDVKLHINGKWRDAIAGETLDVINPATEDIIGNVAHARSSDLDEALEAADRAFKSWKSVSAFDRYNLMRKAGTLLRERAEDIAGVMTLEQGKPLAESKIEVAVGADRIDWMAEEARRAYGRIIPPRVDGVYQLVVKEPVGPVAAFTPWNFPINQAVQKISAAVAAGCSVILKGPEEAPASTAALIKAFVDAGIPDGVLNLVFGVPAEISDYLIPHPIIRKITFTGSTAVGKQLAAKAGEHMKLATMELGGHAPAIVFEDADIDVALNVLSANKFRNAGQVCIAPTRFLVHEKLYEQFVDGFTKIAEELPVGDGGDPKTKMGPLAHDRRLEAMEGFVSDAVGKGADIKTGGQRVGNKGYFFQPTVLTNVSKDTRIMNEEPFGPLAPITPFNDFDEVMGEANRLSYGLAAYAYTRSTKTAEAVGAALESGIVSINHHGAALVETPFGGIKDSGYGREGGLEGLECYLHSKFITQAN